MNDKLGDSLLDPELRFRVTRRVAFLAACSFLLPGPLAAFADDVSILTFDILYKSFGVRGLEFSDRVAGLSRKPVAITGYMAPPLRAESKFFVLTKEPMAICPFCQSDADWPLDIVVVFLKNVSPLVSAGARVTVSGLLETGSSVDAESGFVSQLRIVDASYRRA